MTVLVKRDAKGEIVIDLDTVEEYDRLLEEACQEGKTRPLGLLSLAATMDREQLVHLVSLLSAKAEHYARLWRHSFTPEHAELTARLRDVRRMAAEQGIDLWPELERR